MYYFIPTENQLTQEARPPPEADFYDAFQKLKHALNLLVSFTWDIIHDCFVLPAYRTFLCPLLTCISFSVICITTDIKGKNRKPYNHTNCSNNIDQWYISVQKSAMILGVGFFHMLFTHKFGRGQKKLNKVVGSGTSKELPSYRYHPFFCPCSNFAQPDFLLYLLLGSAC